jgi:hypothetical protein
MSPQKFAELWLQGQAGEPFPLAAGPSAMTEILDAVHVQLNNVLLYAGFPEPGDAAWFDSVSSAIDKIAAVHVPGYKFSVERAMSSADK